jgi:CBS domain-containing protein
MGEEKLVRDLMTGEVTTLCRNDRLTIADDVMRLGRIRHLPVVDDDDHTRAVGILSQRDLFRGALARALGYGEVAQSKLMGMLYVKEVMTPEPVAVPPDMTLAEAAKLMLHRKLGCVLVEEDGRLVGILTEADFVRYHATQR